MTRKSVPSVEQLDAQMEMKFADFFQRLVQVCKSDFERSILLREELMLRTHFIGDTALGILQNYMSRQHLREVGSPEIK